MKHREAIAVSGSTGNVAEILNSDGSLKNGIRLNLTAMEIQLIKTTILVISIISLFLNCKNGNTDNLALPTSNENINYLSENYVTDYRLNIDGSTISDHPFYDYIDCNKESFFSVHFIAKNQNLRLYWKNEFLAQSNYEYDDTTSENRLIKEKLEENFNDYNIFACHITKEYIKNTQDCT